MRKGFSLIELLTVISIITLLASIFFAVTASSYRKGRDAKRIEQVHQIDLAVQHYKADNNGNAPTLQSTCGADKSYAASCVAVSSAAPNTAEAAGWTKFKSDIQPYMPAVPDDPCGSSCTSASGGPVGYTYVSPAAMNYLCGNFCDTTGASLADSYQLYATLEATSTPSGSSSFGSFFFPSSSAPTITFSANPTSVSANGHTLLTWSTANATSCTGSGSGSVGSWPGSKTLSGSLDPGAIQTTTTFTLNCNGSGGSTSQSVVVISGSAPPVLNFSADPTAIIAGESSTLTWTTSGATPPCGISGTLEVGAGPFPGLPLLVSASGSTRVTPGVGAFQPDTATYTLSCTGPGGNSSQSVSITVTPFTPSPP